MRMSSCCGSEHCPSLCLSFSFFPFPLIPQFCTVSVLPQAMALGMSQSSGAWGYAATQNSLVLQGHLSGLLFPKSWECTPSLAPRPAPIDHVLQLERVAGLGFISFPSLHSSLVYLMLLNFNFLKMTQTRRDSSDRKCWWRDFRKLQSTSSQLDLLIFFLKGFKF